MRIFPAPVRLLKEAWSTLDHWIFSRWHSIASVMGAGGEPSYTGKSIDEIKALNCSTVYACARVIADPVAMLPLHLYERLADDERRRATGDPLYRLLRMAPNRFTPAVNFRQTMQLHALLWGNGYARIVRRSNVGRTAGQVLSFRIIDPRKVNPKMGDDGPVYEISRSNGPVETLGFRDVLHIPGLGFDGVKGESVIRFAANTIGLDLAALEYGGSFFAKGGKVPYLLKLQKRLDPEKKDQFRSEWEKTYSQPHTAPILEGDVDYQQIGFKPEDAQLLSTRQFSVPEICRWFLVNPYKVGDGRHATLNNVEHLGIEFLQTTLGYWLEVWVQQIWLRVLTESQQDKLYAEFDQNKLLQGDFKTRMEGYAIAKNNGWMTANQVCARENLPKLPGESGDAYHIQGAMVTVPGTGEPTTYEQAILARANATKTPPEQPAKEAA